MVEMKQIITIKLNKLWKLQKTLNFQTSQSTE